MLSLRNPSVHGPALRRSLPRSDAVGVGAIDEPLTGCIVDVGGAKHGALGRVAAALGDVGGNYKTAAALKESPLQRAGPHVDSYNLSQGKFVFREFLCPGCGVLLETEVALRGDAYEWDVEVR